MKIAMVIFLLFFTQKGGADWGITHRTKDGVIVVAVKTNEDEQKGKHQLLFNNVPNSPGEPMPGGRDVEKARVKACLYVESLLGEKPGSRRPLFAIHTFRKKHQCEKRIRHAAEIQTLEELTQELLH